LVRLIEEAEQRDPASGPFRVHRMPIWFPASWFTRGSPSRFLEITQWEYDTIKPDFATLGHLSYTITGGALDLDDLTQFFQCLYLPLDTSRAPLRDAVNGQQVLYHTRRGFDLWNTRYFVLPVDPAGWQDFSRGFAAFLTDKEILAPDPGLLEKPEKQNELEAWIQEQDWVLLRNQAAYPRTWVVHRARFLKPIRSGDQAERQRIMEQILYPPDDPLWYDPGRRVYDPHTLAWIETDEAKALSAYAPGTGADPAESVVVSRYEPQCVEIEARLRRPGIVILADVHYPGWTLTIDGQPAPILRANRLMRGAAVGAGTHRLVYTYRPLSFRLGGVISLVSLGIGLVLWLAGRGRRRSGPGGD
jgi:hypothetical protein